MKRSRERYGFVASFRSALQRPAPAIVLLLPLALLPVEAGAQVCVDCVGPDRTYSCTIKDADKLQQFRGSQRAQEFVCLSELARAGGHQTCRLNTTFRGPCIGEPHELDVSQIGREPAKDGAGLPGEPDQKSTATPARKGPPETMEQLARETFQKSKEQISAADESMKKAGDAVGGAAQKTWTCVVSLFQKC